jgi:hypothetical protein
MIFAEGLKILKNKNIFIRISHKINYPPSQNQLNTSSMMRKLIVLNFAVGLKILKKIKKLFMRTSHKINYLPSQNQLNASSMMRKLIMPNFAVGLKILKKIKKNTYEDFY